VSATGVGPALAHRRWSIVNGAALPRGPDRCAGSGRPKDLALGALVHGVSVIIVHDDPMVPPVGILSHSGRLYCVAVQQHYTALGLLRAEHHDRPGTEHLADFVTPFFM
jgi:hypothetical protein